MVGAEVNEGELVAFVAYAIAFPTNFLALIDTYDILKSGVVNFCAVALALHQLGYRALGIRIDSGDLAWFSKEARDVLQTVGNAFQLPWLGTLSVVVSNDINEDTLHSLTEQGHSIDAFGVGTHLVTCQKQPALGCVFKLVSVNHQPRIKLSQDVSKITLPGHKKAYRLYGKSGHAINDLLLLQSEPEPHPGVPILCRHPFQVLLLFKQSSNQPQTHERNQERRSVLVLLSNDSAKIGGDIGGDVRSELKKRRGW